MPSTPEHAAERHRLPPLERVVLDIIGPTVEDVLGNTALLTTRCVGSNMKRVVPLPDKEGPTVWLAFCRVYPGSRLQPRPRFPAVIGCDNDASFMGVFEIEAVKRGARFDRSLPRRPASTGADGCIARRTEPTAGQHFGQRFA